MCTAIGWNSGSHYFGRNLDLEYAYEEAVTVVPRGFPLTFRRKQALGWHYAMIGMAYVRDGYPLFYDAVNEKGLSMAGLNFPGSAVYRPEETGKDNIASFELIPWILSRCGSVDEARTVLSEVNCTDIAFSDDLPPSPLHWIVSDKSGALTVEPAEDGLRLYENPISVLTNNPPFPWHMQNLNNYMFVSARSPENCFSDRVKLDRYSLGMGGLGLPGDFSSASRFVKAAFVKLNSPEEKEDDAAVRQLFHILGAVSMPRGSVAADSGLYEITRYTSCCNADKGVYFYTTYENGGITAVNMHAENLDGDSLSVYPLLTGHYINYLNG